MEFKTVTTALERIKTSCLVIGLYQGTQTDTVFTSLDTVTGGWLSKQIKRGDITGAKGQTLYLYDPPGLKAERLLLIGCGDAAAFGERGYIEANQTAARTLSGGGAKQAVNTLPALSVGQRDADWKTTQAVLAAEYALYTFDEFKTASASPKQALKRLDLWMPEAPAATTLARAVATAHGVAFARDLANRPGNVCHPTYLAKQAKALKKRFDSIELDVLDEAAMEKLGMGAFLAVSKGSAQPGKLIVMQYRGGEKNAKPIALVGKGVTFDTGGISIKPAAQMDEMKFDMGGAASVFGTLLACAEAKLELNIVGVIAAAENMPGGRASRPGDIVKTLSGQSVEILNTDAEGRLVLCDALTYVERFEPSAVVDMATLTGACIVALGHEVSAILGNHPPLIDALKHAGQETFDRIWELPLLDEYQDQLKSNFADMANIGGRAGGTITAACFLSRFTRKYNWAHLDIAGTAWVSGDKKGATGRPVPLLVEYLTHCAADPS
ncbi:leucyl aminopeptidase [Acidihalobacter ferrooxydans]|uniref:Probable cytosol aminopeptidase n=1 Tax=Acidihalobacter ferrooxydans TaxID=1765967 RepID=A0A1P8UHE3_9GAMM|nr:leucyl aminopeptidase [Acidihalobacter ferrooxydans]APZ43249.1 leucyl aminopeptidase [Acidihalobacter ferrooxydans]